MSGKVQRPSGKDLKGKEPAATGSKKSSKSFSSAKEPDFLTPLELEELRECFQLFDEGAGVDPTELHGVMTDLGLDRRCQALYLIISELPNCRNPLSFEEFSSLVNDKLGDAKTKAGLSRIFNYFDQDGNGRLQPDNLSKGAGESGHALSADRAELIINGGSALLAHDSRAGWSAEQFYSTVLRKPYRG